MDMIMALFLLGPKLQHTVVLLINKWELSFTDNAWEQWFQPPKAMDISNSNWDLRLGDACHVRSYIKAVEVYVVRVHPVHDAASDNTRAWSTHGDTGSLHWRG